MLQSVASSIYLAGPDAKSLKSHRANFFNFPIDRTASRGMNQELTIRLIQRYGQNRLLWDSEHPHHLVSKLRRQCWTKIAKEYKCPISVLKKKMASLMGSHRRELHRERKSRIRAAATGNARYIYSSKWFGYPYFDFIRKNRKKLINTHHKEPIDDSQPSSHTANDEDTDVSSTELQQFHTTEELEQVMIMSPQPPSPTYLPSRNKRCRNPEVTREDSEYEEDTSNIANDHYTSFGNYIVSELRKYDPRTLACVKHAIHNVIFQADLGNIQFNNSVADHIAHPSQSSASFVTEMTAKFSPAASDDALSF